MHRVEFTIEPFIEGNPGRHVVAPVEALHAIGVDVEVGPFGSSFEVDAHHAGAAVSALIGAAFQHGATHVNVDIQAARS